MVSSNENERMEEVTSERDWRDAVHPVDGEIRSQRTNEPLVKSGYGRLDNNSMVNLATGEVVPSVTVQVPFGSIFYTPEQQKAYERRKEQAAAKEYARKSNRALGTFYFANSSYSYDDIAPQNMVRLIYLATYIPYGERTLVNGRHQMDAKELQKVLRVSDATFSRFWCDVMGKYLFKDDDGHFYMASNFTKGKLDNGDDHATYHKVYTRAVRQLYESCPVSKHKLLGSVFQMLPYMSVEFNVLCRNPYEKNLDEIQPITLNEFCRMIGQTEEKRARVIKDFEKIKFPVKDHTESFCSFVTEDSKLDSAKIFVNPKILYSGTDWKTVEVLGAFTKKNA